MTLKSSARQESEMFLGILLFGPGMGLVTMFLSPSSGGASFIIGFVVGLFLRGGLDLIIHRSHF